MLLLQAVGLADSELYSEIQTKLKDLELEVEQKRKEIAKMTDELNQKNLQIENLQKVCILQY